MRKRLAIVCSIIIIFIVLLLLNGSPSQYSIELAAGLTLLNVPLWVWALHSEIKKLVKNDSFVGVIAVKSEKVDNDSKIEHNEVAKVPAVTRLKVKSEKDSIYLQNIDKPQELNFDNDFIDEIYEKAVKLALSLYSDSELSSFSIQVFPYWRIETVDVIIKSRVTIYFYFYSKNAEKYFGVRFNELAGISHDFPDEDATCDFQRIVFSELPWRGVYWKGFVNKAYDKVKPLAISEKTYYNISASSSSNVRGWSVVFFDGFSGRKRSYSWNGKGTDENNINIVLF